MDKNEQTPAEPQDGEHASKARRSRRKPATTEVATEMANPPDAPHQDTQTPPEQDAAATQQWVSKLPEPFGRHTIDIGDSRRLKLLRSNRWQQAQIVFTSSEGQDPKPDAKYTHWLREHGWQWRGGEKTWTKQFARNTDEERYARSNSDLAAQQEFIELANLIRQDKGMEPIQPVVQQQQAYGTGA